MADDKSSTADRNFDLFVVSTSLEKPDIPTRKLIRSHVMQGKNRHRPTKPRSKARCGSWINGDHGEPDDEGGPAKKQHTLVFPRLCTTFEGSGLSVTHFAADMQPYMLDLVFKFFTIIKQSLYPIELCLMFDPKNSIWFEYLQIDAMYLHSIMWTSEAYFDWFKGCGNSRAALIHEAKTLNLLQTRLMEPTMATSDTTISVVVSLVIMGTLLGNYKTAREHMAGLEKLVVMRGGLHALKGNSQIQVKICRADIGLALSCGTSPLFFSKGISWGRILPTVNGRHPRLPTQFFALDMDIRLQNILADLRLFCVSANLAFQTAQKIEPEMFQEVLISIEYRLMLLDCKDRLLETFRLGILAFSTTAFLQTNGIKARFEKLSNQLRDSILQQVSLNDSRREVWLWILFVAAISSVADENDFWLMPRIKAALLKSGMVTWEGVQNILKSILWINSLHDQDGKRVFEQSILQDI